jgi:hypothetical protein
MTHKGIKCSDCPFKYDKYPDCLHSFITKYGSDCTLINKLKQEKKQ